MCRRYPCPFPPHALLVTAKPFASALSSSVPNLGGSLRGRNPGSFQMAHGFCGLCCAATTATARNASKTRRSGGSSKTAKTGRGSEWPSPQTHVRGSRRTPTRMLRGRCACRLQPKAEPFHSTNYKGINDTHSDTFSQLNQVVQERIQQCFPPTHWQSPWAC